MESTVIIADDLTGANDTGVQFSRHGLRTIVIIDSDKVIDYITPMAEVRDVLAINADTRRLTAATAYQRVYELAGKLKKAHFGRVYKKIDSTLRGHPGAELEAVMDAWELEFALVVPAFPDNRRLVHNGRLIIRGDAAATVEAAGEGAEESCLHIPAVLQAEMKRRVGQVNLAAVRRGAGELVAVLETAKREQQVLVLDAVENGDLQIIAQAIRLLPQDVVLAGAAGLASHLTAASDLKAATGRRVTREGMVLFVAGTRNPVSALQMQQLVAYSDCRLVEVDTEAIVAGRADAEVQRVLGEVGEGKDRKSLVMIAVANLLHPSPADDGNRNAGEIIAKTLGAITRYLVAAVKTRGLVITGGSTAVCVCRALEAWGINLDDEILPGIPLGYLEGGRAGGLPIVTKAGGFGPPEAFIKVCQHLDQSTEC